jgi:hypothetical protein
MVHRAGHNARREDEKLWCIVANPSVLCIQLAHSLLRASKAVSGLVDGIRYFFVFSTSET